MNPADVQAVLAANNTPAPSVEGLQRLADWGTAFQKIAEAGVAQDYANSHAILTQAECLAILHYIRLLGG